MRLTFVPLEVSLTVLLTLLTTSSALADRTAGREIRASSFTRPDATRKRSVRWTAFSRSTRGTSRRSSSGATAIFVSISRRGAAGFRPGHPLQPTSSGSHY